MGKGTGQFLGEGEVDALIGSVSVGLGTDETESDDLANGVHLLELGEEGDRSSHTVRASILAIPELSSSLHDTLCEPGAEFSHAPSLSFTLRSANDLGVVRNIGGQKFGDSSVSVIRVNFRRESDGETHGGGRTANVTSSLNSRESSSTGDGHVGSPGVVEVHLVDTFFVHAIDTFTNVVFFVHFRSAQFSHEFSFGLESLGDLAVECLATHASLRVINTIEEVTHDTHSLGYDSTNFARVISTVSAIDLHVKADDTTERRGHPELVPVEGSGVHAEHDVRSAEIGRAHV